MARHLLLLGLMLSTGALLCSCDRHDDSDASRADPFAASATTKGDQFGKEFGKASRADPNSTPANVSEVKLPPISYTTEPAEIH